MPRDCFFYEGSRKDHIVFLSVRTFTCLCKGEIARTAKKTIQNSMVDCYVIFPAYRILGHPVQRWRERIAVELSYSPTRLEGSPGSSGGQLHIPSPPDDLTDAPKW